MAITAAQVNKVASQLIGSGASIAVSKFILGNVPGFSQYALAYRLFMSAGLSGALMSLDKISTKNLEEAFASFAEFIDKANASKEK